MDYTVQPGDTEIGFKRWMNHIIDTGYKAWGFALENKEQFLFF